MNQKIQFTVLSFIDGILGSLARGGPGREGAIVSRKFYTNTPEEWRAWIYDYRSTKCGKLQGDPCSVIPALYMARAMLEVLYDAIPKFPQLPAESQFSAFFVMRDWPMASFVSLAKWATVYPLARFLHQDLPKVPEVWIPFGEPDPIWLPSTVSSRPTEGSIEWERAQDQGGYLLPYPGCPLLFAGSCKRLLKNRLHSFNRRNLFLWNSYLQGIKRGCQVVPDYYIQESMEKHQLKMLSPDPMTEEFESEFQDYCLRLTAPKIKRQKGRGFVESGVPFRSRRAQLFEASPSASIDATRGMGGGREFIRDDIAHSFQPRLEHGLLKAMELAPGSVSYLHGAVSPPIKEVIQIALAEKARSMVHAVLEPLKVRLITKGPTYCQWISRFFQKSMWDYLQKFPQFALTGRPLDPGDLAGILQREKTIIRKSSWNIDLVLWSMDDPRWVSGDFSAATDSSSQKACKSVLETLLASCTFQKGIKKILRKTLYEQEIYYPPERKIKAVDQVNGQLMGSVLSFPVLCLMNFICYWMAFEQRFSCRVNPRDLPVLVNGDDILFRADSWLYEIWQTKIKECGFVLSLGKNYIHSNVLVINSEMFLFDHDRETFRKINFFNTGLLTGQSKLTGRSDVRIMPLPAVYNEVVPQANDQARAFRRFLHYHKDQIVEWTNRGNYNLFIPIWRGGLGMEIPRGHSFSITSFQRRLASLIQEKRDICIKEGRPLKGLAVGVIREGERSSLSFKHFIRWIDVPRIGPLPENFLEYTNRDVVLPILALAYDPDPTLSLKIPKHRNLRIEPCRRMSTRALFEAEPRLVEDIGWVVKNRHLLEPFPYTPVVQVYRRSEGGMPLVLRKFLEKEEYEEVHGIGGANSPTPADLAVIRLEQETYLERQDAMDRQVTQLLKEYGAPLGVLGSS